MPVWLSAFLIALVVGTLVEYWGHRLMHAWLLRKRQLVQELRRRESNGERGNAAFNELTSGEFHGALS